MDPKMMKINKDKLKQIIKEELDIVLEGNWNVVDGESGRRLLADLRDLAELHGVTLKEIEMLCQKATFEDSISQADDPEYELGMYRSIHGPLPWEK
jgi:hypothetical protein